MGRLQKTIAFLMVPVISVCSFSASAEQSDDQAYQAALSAKVENSSYSEYSTYKELRECDEGELLDMGFSESEIEELYAFDYESALMERAQLPEEQLTAMGYTEEQVGVLQAYSLGEVSFEEAATRTSATCTGSLIRKKGGTDSSGKQYVSVCYYWRWSSCPVMRYKDTAAVGYVGVDTEGNFKAINSGTVSCSLTATYTLEDGTVQTSAVSPTSINAKEYGTSCTYNVGDYVSSYWISKGTITVLVTEEGSYDMLGVYAKGSVAHSVASATISPSVSFGSELGVSVSFSPQSIIDVVGEVDKYLYCTP